MPLTTPTASEWNFMPTSIDCASPWSGSPGVTFDPQIEQGHVMFTADGEVAPPMLSLSSIARDLIEVLGAPCAIHVYDHVVLAEALAMLAGCQVVPPSV